MATLAQIGPEGQPVGVNKPARTGLVHLFINASECQKIFRVSYI